MSSVHCVVVWEWQCRGQWLPHSPGVSRTLERAHLKKLTRVVLADAEPELRGHYVNLRTLTQSCDTPEGGSAECAVRRACYSVQSAGGRGAAWSWARAPPPPRRGDLVYEPLPMEVQNLLEEAWSAGGTGTVQWQGWALQPARMAARHAGGALRVLRRRARPPYPLARHAPPPPPPPPPPNTRESHRCRIPQQHTGSSVHSVQSTHSAHSASSAASTRTMTSQRSNSPKDRKPGLARQILHNLNIFSHKSGGGADMDNASAGGGDTCGAGSGTGGGAGRDEGGAGSGAGGGASGDEGGAGTARRHSVDTVSTYLSHESKDSLQQGSVGSLLNCSVGSDEVFETAAPPAAEPAPAEQTIVGVDWASAQVSGWVRLVRCVQWGALCPACLRPLAAAPGAGPEPAGGGAVALPCHHMLHLDCLNERLRAVAEAQESMYIECLVCGRVYGGSGGAGAGAVPGAEHPAWEQPPGSMSWAVQPPDPDTNERHILVTYNFQSGVQGSSPGQPYYAVGFPRHSLLPDTPLGRQVLSALRRVWEARALFTLHASRTTGRELVVAWRVPPPPPPSAPPAALLHALHHYNRLAPAPAH